MITEKRKLYNIEYYAKNKHKWANSTPQRRARKAEIQRAYQKHHAASRRKYEQARVERQYERMLWLSSKRSARYRNLDHTITMEDIQIPLVCPYLKTPLTRTQGKGLIWTNASIDRIDNRRGYVPGNIQIISRLANAMKQSATINQLQQFAKSILNIHGEL